MKKMTMKKAFPWLVLAAAYVLNLAFYAMFGMHNMDSDLASEMIYANLLNEEGKLISTSWLYSTELRVVSMIPVYQAC